MCEYFVKHDLAYKQSEKKIVRVIKDSSDKGKDHVVQLEQEARALKAGSSPGVGAG